MTNEDAEFVLKCLEAKVIHSPCLELGAGYGGDTSRELVERAGIEYFTTDIKPGPGVDYAVDFEAAPAEVSKGVKGHLFGSVMVMNVLEHTFEPLKVLDNSFHILRPGGTCIISCPAVWPLHNYPKDHWRTNPDVFEEYAARRGHHLHEEFFEFLGQGRVKARTDGVNGAYVLPPPKKTLTSRIVHRVFNTFARGVAFPSHIQIGCVIEKVAG